MEERRLLLAVALSLLVLTAYSLLFSPPPPAPAPATLPAPGAATRGTDLAPAPPGPAASAEASPARAEATAAKAVADPRERRVEVAAPDFTVAFTNRGARLVSWTLARYRDARGAPEEMVPAGAGVRPLDVETGIPELDAQLRDALFVPSAETLALRAGEPQSLRFDFAAGELEATKTLTFQAPGLVELSVVVKRAGRDVPTRLLWGPGIGNPSAEEREVQGYQEPAGVALTGGGRRTPPGEEPPRDRPEPRRRALGGRREPLLRGALRGAGRAARLRRCARRACRPSPTRSRTRFPSWRSMRPAEPRSSSSWAPRTTRRWPGSATGSSGRSRSGTGSARSWCP